MESLSCVQCRLYMLLFCYRLYLLCKSQFLKHSQAASGLKIKCPQIKNRLKPQVDTYVRRSGKNFQHSIGPKLSDSKALQYYWDKLLQICVEPVDYWEFLAHPWTNIISPNDEFLVQFKFCQLWWWFVWEFWHVCQLENQWQCGELSFVSRAHNSWNFCNMAK